MCIDRLIKSRSLIKAKSIVTILFLKNTQSRDQSGHSDGPIPGTSAAFPNLSEVDLTYGYNLIVSFTKLWGWTDVIVAIIRRRQQNF